MPFEFVRGVHLRRSDENIDEIEALARLCAGRVGVENLLADLDRKARRAWVPGLRVHRGYTWEWHDQVTRRWWPQGVTTSADASDSEDVDGRRLVLVAWYSKQVGGVGKGVRVSFLDPDTLRYRHVLLVQPVLRDGRVDLEPLQVHAGGIVWCGPYLHVAATRRGIHTARMDDLVRVPDQVGTAEHTRLGAVGERLATFGYRYLLPVRFSYEARHEEGHDPMRYSFLSLDRLADPPQLVAGEYGRGRMSTRLVRYPLDPATLHIHSSEDGISRPLLLDDQGEAGMQGAAIVRGTWYVTASNGSFGLGSVYVGTPGRFTRHRWALPMGPEDITYWPSTDLLWSASEWPWRRWVFSMRRSDFD
jgi:hypothetical protein